MKYSNFNPFSFSFYPHHHASNSNWILIKKYPFKCTSIWTSIIKRLWRGKKMFKVTLKLQRYFVIYIRSPLKMQKIIKQTFGDRQLCFYEIFWFFSQNNHFLGISPFFREICVMHYGSIRTLDLESDAWRESPKN